MNRPVVATVGLAALVTSACGGDGGRSATPAPSTTSTTGGSADGAPGTTDASGSGPATSPDATSPPTTSLATLDWDGVRYDLGIIDRIDRTEDGRTLVVFDRVQLADDPQRSGADFTEEPIVHGNTDVVFINDNTRLRTYVADDRVEVLHITNLRDTCADRDNAADAVWAPVTVDEVVDRALWDEFPQVSLTFGTDGRVARIRLSSGC